MTVHEIRYEPLQFVTMIAYDGFCRTDTYQVQCPIIVERPETTVDLPEPEEHDAPVS